MATGNLARLASNAADAAISGKTGKPGNLPDSSVLGLCSMNPKVPVIFRTRSGIPRKIGAITEQALTYAMFDQKCTVTPEMVLRVKNLER